MALLTKGNRLAALVSLAVPTLVGDDLATAAQTPNPQIQDLRQALAKSFQRNLSFTTAQVQELHGATLDQPGFLDHLFNQLPSGRGYEIATDLPSLRVAFLIYEDPPCNGQAALQKISNLLAPFDV